ncbi:MAG: preprotein translocase subunit YajC [Bordetella sp.]|nr:MAG: preprotein translocase subunit YajC [Bordetella sp.]
MITLNIFNSVIAQLGSTREGGILMNMLPILLIFAVLYLMMIRPQIKRQKEHTKLITNLMHGDEIVTNGGILGRINKIKDNYITLEISDLSGKSVEIIIQKTAISNILPKGTIKAL